MAARTGRPTLLAPLLAVLVSCSAPATARQSATWRVAAEPDLVIGVQPTRAGHRLVRVVGAARLTDGRIAVAEAATGELRIFSPRGTLLTTFAAPTARFLELLGHLPGDTLLVLSTDGLIERVDPDGRVRERRSMPFRAHQGGCRALSSCSMQFVPDGRLMMRRDVPAPSEACGATVPTVRRTRARVVLIDWRTGRTDTLGAFPGTEWTGRNGRAYGAELALAGSPGHIFAGETAGDSIVVLGLDGTRLDRWRLPLEARTVSRAARRRDREPAGMLRNPPAGNAWSFPDRYPRFARLLADRAGFLWVMRYPEATDPLRAARFQCSIAPDVPPGGASWVVLSPDGGVASEVRTPPDLFPFEVGDDYVLGVATDSIAGPTVRLHTLHRDEPAPTHIEQLI